MIYFPNQFLLLVNWVRNGIMNYVQMSYNLQLHLKAGHVCRVTGLPAEIAWRELCMGR